MPIQLTEIAQGKVTPGVYYLDRQIAPAELEKLVTDGAIVSYFDGNLITDVKSLFIQFEKVLAFPDYFGHNWDAVADCLTDLNFSPTEIYILIFKGFNNFADRYPQEWQTLQDICTTTIEYWQDCDVRLYIVFAS
jgi:RNAse (barnase) inhibitor barstar